MAPSTLGTFLRAFTFGHVRQLDRVLGETLQRAWQAGAGPGDGRLVVDVDSFVGETFGRDQAGRGVRLHTRARLSPDPRHARRHRRGPAHPAPEGLGEHLARVRALPGRAARARRARRRDGPAAAAGRQRLLEQADLQAARSGGLAVLDRRAPATRGPGGDRGDRRERLDRAARLPRRPRSRRSPRPRSAAGGWSFAASARSIAKANCSRPGSCSRSSPTAPRTCAPSRPSTANTPSSSSPSATSKTRRSRTSRPGTSTPTPPGR